LDDLYCVACDKTFKTYGAKDNHETSKKHKENLDKLILEMKDEEINEISEEIKEESEELNEIKELDSKIPESNNDVQSDHSVTSGDSESEIFSSKSSKKKKKKGNGNRKPMIEHSSDDKENKFLKGLSESSDEDKFSKRKKKKGKDKKKQIKLKEETKTLNTEGSTDNLNINSAEVSDTPKNEENGHEDNLNKEKVIDDKDSHMKPIPDEGRFKVNNKNKPPRFGMSDEKEILNLSDSSDDDALSKKKRKKGKDKKKMNKIKEAVINDLKERKKELEVDINSVDSTNYILDESNPGNLKTIENNIEKVIENKEDSETQSVQDERHKRKKNKKPTKPGKYEEIDPELNRGDLNCAQCKSTFPSKNKLYNHLKVTGHAVYLPGGKEQEPTSSKSKKKKGKN